MRKFYFLFISCLLIFTQSNSQAFYTWVGGAAGDYQVSTNWMPTRSSLNAGDSLGFNATSAITVNNVPNQTIGAIKIISGTSAVSFATNTSTNVLTLGSVTPLLYATAGKILSADFLTIRLGAAASFAINSGTFGIAPSTGGKINISGALTLSGGIFDVDVPGTGGTIISGSVTYISGTFTCLTNSSITWLSGSNYYHAFGGATASAIPAATWLSGSTCNITGMSGGNIAPTGIVGVDFSNFTWNCPAQAGTVYLLPAASTLNMFGAFTLTTTNNKELRASASGKTTINAGSYSQIAGTLTLQANAAFGDTTTLTVSGGFSHTGGYLNAVGNGSPGAAIVDLKGDVTKTGGIWQSSSNNALSQFILQFSGTAFQTVAISGLWYDPAGGRCNIVINNQNGATGISITGTLKVVNTSSSSFPATCTVSSPLIGGTGVVAYSGAGTGGNSLIYTGNLFQTATAIEFPATSGPQNLTINNSLGISFPASFSRTIPGTLTMLGGNLAIGAGNTLSLTNLSLASQLSYSAGFITTGTLGRYFPTSGLPVSSSINGRFPFGAGVNDRAVNVFFSASNLGSGTAGMIYVKHTPIIGIFTTSPFPLQDDLNAITLDKRTNTSWDISTGAFSLGGGGETVSVTATGGNIGSVDVYGSLRLTDGATTNYATTIPTSGSNAVPTVGKSGLLQADLNKTFYVASDFQNPLIIITFTWTGASLSTSNWNDPANWTGGVGFPSASTEIAIITNTGAPRQPNIPSGLAINVFQLTVGSGMTLTMTGTTGITVYDSIKYTGAAAFSATSTFGFANPNNTFTQIIPPLSYGNLTVTGAGFKSFPTGTISVRGTYNMSGYPPLISTNTFVYNGTGAQKVTATNYYNLTLTGARGGTAVSLGDNVALNTIDVNNVFDVSGLSNYVSKPDFNTMNFSSPSTTVAQVIPGFYYGIVSNGPGLRTLDNLGSSNATHVISCRSLNRGVGTYNYIGSKVNLYVSGTGNPTYQGNQYYDLTLSGDLKNFTIDFFNGNTVSIAGSFDCQLTNFKQGTNVYTMYFNGTGNQTIPGYKYINATTPAFRFSNVNVAGGNRDVTLSPTDTVGIRGTMTVPTFGGGHGFIVAGSTVKYSVGSSPIPVLPTVSGTINYNNLAINGGTHILGGNMTIGGDLSVSGVVDTIPGILNIGNGSTPVVLNVLGNINISGTGSGTVATGQIDMNPQTGGTSKINLAGNLTISGNGQLTGTTGPLNNNGTVVFNGSTPQTYKNTSTTFSNGLVNFIVGDGTLASNLTLASSMTLLASANPTNKSKLTVTNNSSLNCGTNNIYSNTAAGSNAIFNLNSGATLITSNSGGIEGAANSTSTGSIVNDATIVKTYDDNANYTFNGATITPFSTGVPNIKMASLTINANVSLDKSMKLSNVFTLGNSAVFTLPASDLTLMSTVSTTARVAQVPATAAVAYGTGRFNVERYYPAERSWRLATSPLSLNGTPTTIFEAWQNNGVYTPGIGTFVTGPGPTAANGLDYSNQNNFSLKKYENNAYVNVDDTKIPLSNNTLSAANIGYFIFVRGDRSRSPDNTNTSNFNITTLSSRGKLQYGTQTFTGITRPVPGLDRLFILVGNPYASPVNFNKISRNNIANRFIVWDPKLGTVGAFVTVDDYFNSGTYVLSTPSTGGQDTTIQSSQAFFVETDTLVATTSTIVFNETNKSTINKLGMFRPIVPAATIASLRSSLYILNADSTRKLADGNVVQFNDNFNNTVDFQDALKITNVNETFGLMRDGSPIAIERRKTITADDTLYLNLVRSSKRNYQFEFEPTNMDPLLTAFLEDSYTGTQTPLSVTSATTFNFAINSDTKSSAANRFRIVFKNGTMPLPVKYSSIKAYQKANDIAVEWTVENEINIVKYAVEKSADGVNFIRVNTTIAKGTGNGSINYSFLDVKAVPGNNFYRILNYDQTGAIEYSRVVLVKIGKSGTGISIYPNPVTGNTIGLSFSNMDKGAYGIKLINTLGQTLMIQQINHNSGSSMETLTPGSKLSAGVYQLEITAPDRSTNTVKVIVQ